MDLIELLTGRKSFIAAPDRFVSPRPRRVDIEGSEYFSWIYPVTATTATSRISMQNQFPNGRRYLPFDWVEITNNEPANPLTVFINNVTTIPYYIPPKVIRVIAGKDIAIWQIAIRNDGLVNTTLGLVQLLFKRLSRDEFVTREIGAEI